MTPIVRTFPPSTTRDPSGAPETALFDASVPEPAPTGDLVDARVGSEGDRKRAQDQQESDEHITEHALMLPQLFDQHQSQ
jgi:hypothetical protein